MTVHAMWKVPAWGMTFQLRKQTQVNHQNCKPRCVIRVFSFQISHLIVMAEFTPF